MNKTAHDKVWILVNDIRSKFTEKNNNMILAKLQLKKAMIQGKLVAFSNNI